MRLFVAALLLSIFSLTAVYAQPPEPWRGNKMETPRVSDWSV